MTEIAIRCRELRKVYPPDVLAVDGLDLEVQAGECFGLLGPNGAGKTTTIEILEGLLEPTSGLVEVLGSTWLKEPTRLRQEIGISLQETRLPEKLSVLEVVRLFRSFYQDGFDPQEAIDLVDLGEKAAAWVGKLSGGQRQRLQVACAVVGKPRLLFLDEPTTGLDPQSRRKLWEIIRLLRNEGRTVLLTTHYMDEAERLCDRVAIVHRGRVIACDSPPNLIAGVGGEHLVEFTTTNGTLDDPECSRLPGVLATHRDGDSISLVVSAPHETVPALLGSLDRHELRLRSLSTHRTTVEDVFVRLTGHHLDEDSKDDDG